MSEEEIRALMRVDPEAGSAALYRTYYRYVYAAVYRRVHVFGSHEDVEECTADVLREVIVNFDAVDPGSLRSYISVAARNRAVNVCRRLGARNQQTVPLDSEEFPELPSGEDIAADAERRELTHKLLDCIERLGQPDAAIIIQRYYYDRNSTEIARTLGMKPSTVRSRLKRAIKRLQTLLRDAGVSL